MLSAEASGGRSLGRLLLDRCERHDVRPFLIGPAPAIRPYGELAEQAFAVARYLAAQDGVAPGCRVALVLPTGPLFVAAFFGAVLADCVPVPLDPRLRAPETARSVRHCRCVCALVESSERPDLDPATGLGWTADAGAVLADPRWRRGPVPSPGRGADDDATVVPTSGSTASPKAVVLTHRAIAHDCRAWIERLELTSADVLLSTLALYHAFGLTGWLVTALSAGAAMAMPPDSLPGPVAALARHTRATVLLATGAYYSVLARGSGCSATDFASLRFGVSGACALPTAVHQQWSSRYARPVYPSYGLTEAAPIVTANGPARHRAGTVGMALEGGQVRVEPTGGTADGELWVRGPTVMRGYWDNPASTSACLPGDGWLRTGDLARIDADGFVTLLGRTKELIVRGGEKIYPEEVEDALHEHPQVAEAAVVGQPDARYGERVVAFVAPAVAGTLDAAAVSAFCRERLAAFKVPRDVHVLDALPRTNSGKIDKRALRACCERVAAPAPQ